MHKTNKQRERAFFFFYRMPDSCTVFGCNNKSEGNGRALHGIPFFFLQSLPRVSEKQGKMD